MHLNVFSPQEILLFLHVLISNNKISFAQSITAINQAPGFSSLSSCAQLIAKAVIDDSTSPECPAGSPPSCFCGNEGLSKGYSDQISTNILNNCLTSSRPQATLAASVFAAYCNAEKGAAAASTTAVDQTTSTTAQNHAITSPITSSQALADPSSKVTMTSSDNGNAPSSGLDTSDKIAIGIGVPVGVATILGVWITWKLYQKKIKSKN